VWCDRTGRGGVVWPDLLQGGGGIFGENLGEPQGRRPPVPIISLGRNLAGTPTTVWNIFAPLCIARLDGMRGL
jgi:hypothetical protein